MAARNVAAPTTHLQAWVDQPGPEYLEVEFITEAKLYQLLKRHTPEFQWIRIESSTMAGIFDTICFTPSGPLFIELKMHRGWVELRGSQQAFARRILKVLPHAKFLLVISIDRYDVIRVYEVDPMWAGYVSEYMAFAKQSNKYDWEALKAHLLVHC